MSARRERRGVSLPSGHTASSMLHALLLDAARRERDVFERAALPEDPRRFRSAYGEALVRFEAARVASPRRAEIARDLVRAMEHELCFASAHGDVPLAGYWMRSAEPLALESLSLGSPRGFVPGVPFEGRSYAGKEIAELADLLLERGYLTRAAAGALRWIAEHVEARSGLDLSGHRFVVLGAGAELAATPLLLEAGASVLWIDVADPRPEARAGALSFVPGGADLIARPAEIARTAERFAGSESVHVALYAYAGGGGREWLLSAAMNGIVRKLGPGAVRSVTLLVSPTSPGVVQPEDRARAGRYPASLWQRALERAGAFGPARYAAGGPEVARAVVPIQGASYQAAQYLGKILAAESFAVFGTSLDAPGRAPLTTSANVAGVSRTRSLSHPVFDAAFLAATLFGVTTFDPATTRALNGLLALHDLLNPDAPAAARRRHPDDAARAAALFSQQVHGGIYGIPWALDPCITAAALIGLARRPSLLWRLMRGGRPS